ncbi:MAG TPA: S41 family peptidase [Methylomirabilota bacterium]|jgi:carboxyl-terminal processing protease|nr:S41 family peptidase [Methylomirabilota bacterium]
MTDETPAPEPASQPPSLLSTTPPERPSVPGSSPVTWVVSLLLASMVGALLFAGGYLAAGGGNRGGTCAAPAEAFAALCEAYDKLKQQFVDKLDDTQLAEGAIRGLFEYGVKDPFSGYMSPDEYQRALGSLSGEFTGIGAEMAVKNLENPDDLAACTELSDTCALVVVAPLADSPAEAAGLQSGDIILQVDGESVNGSTLQDEVGKVRGESGTKVRLSVKRGQRTFDLSITRAKIVEKEVTSKMLDGKIGYIALHGFSQRSADEFRTALGALLDDGAVSIVFDLRDNPGGYIDAAQKIASEFMRSGLIFSQESSGGEKKRWESTGDGLATDPKLPLAVLVNGGSASASEIVAAALKESGRGVIIGEPTYGKNTVQVWTELVDHGGVRITISRWFTPDHNSVAPDGVQPDVTVAVPDGTPADQDPVLDRAITELTAPAAFLPWLRAAA